MDWDHREPTLDEMLSDSIIRAVMVADGVDPQELAIILRQIGAVLADGQSGCKIAALPAD